MASSLFDIAYWGGMILGSLSSRGLMTIAPSGRKASRPVADIFAFAQFLAYILLPIMGMFLYRPWFLPLTIFAILWVAADQLFNRDWPVGAYFLLSIPVDILVIGSAVWTGVKMFG